MMQGTQSQCSVTTLSDGMGRVVGRGFKREAHLTSLLRNLYAGQEATVRTGYGTTNCFQIGK